ncbi:hypothetical protein D1007_52301 [Hordeum vulgare]|nr:hypothetical protein D1007_52301 [Hordeum vulgare]
MAPVVSASLGTLGPLLVKLTTLQFQTYIRQKIFQTYSVYLFQRMPTGSSKTGKTSFETLILRLYRTNGNYQQDRNTTRSRRNISKQLGELVGHPFRRHNFSSLNNYSARKKNSSAPISLTLREKEQLRRVNEENAELRRAKEMLQQKVDMHGQLITALFKEIGKGLPARILHILSHGAVSQPEGTNNSSQAGSQAVDGNNDVMGSSEENDATGNVDVDETVDATSHAQTTR